MLMFKDNQNKINDICFNKSIHSKCTYIVYLCINVLCLLTLVYESYD